MYFLCLTKPRSLTDTKETSVLQDPVSNANMHAYASTCLYTDKIRASSQRSLNNNKKSEVAG
jgi:hypothetical protein